MHGEATYRPRSDVRHRRVGSEAVVVRMEAAEVLVLSEVGGRILQLLDGETSIDEVRRQLLEEYTVEPETLETDVHDFIERLLESGVVEEVPEATRGPE